MQQKPHIDEVWLSCKTELKNILSEDIFDRWIEVIEPIDLVDGRLQLAVANGFYKDWLEENYLPLINKVLITNGELALRAELCVHENSFQKEESISLANQEVKPAKRTLLHTSKSKNNLNPAYTFEHFIIGPNNEFAHAAAAAASKSLSRTYNPLFIYGGVGLGKTHLMQAIGHAVLEKRGKTRVCYITCESFTNEYIDALQNNNVSSFRKKYRKIDLLLIDDIHFLDGKKRLQEEFFHTFNALFESHKQIVLTSDRTPSEMEGLAPRLVSRFEWGLVTELNRPDVETRTAILRKKAESMKLTLDLELLDYLALKISSNVRSLEGALIRIATFASLTKQKITQERLQELLRDLIKKEEDQVVDIDLIQRTVADHFNISLSDLVGKKRSKHIVVPRQIAMHLSRTLTNQSYPSIAEKFDRNHATILYAHEQIENKSTEDDRLQDTLIKLTDQISN
jgi:chromosomal replication initiator protein